MDDIHAINHQYSVIGWGALLIWWGIVFLVDPLTIGMGSIGTGLILLGINAARSRKGIHQYPTRRSNTILGIIALGWGLLDLGRTALAWGPGASFALFLIVVGIVYVGSLWFPPAKEDPSELE